MQVDVTLNQITQGNCPSALGDMGVGYIENGIFVTDNSVARYYYELFHNSQGSQKGKREAILRDKLSGELNKNGWITSMEEYTSQGYIDIVATRQGEKRLIEVKVSSDSHTAAHALGQLLFYSHFHPGSSLWFAAPSHPDLTILSILDQYNISFIHIVELKGQDNDN